MARKNVGGMDVVQSGQLSREEEQELKRRRQERIADFAAEMDSSEEFDWDVEKLATGKPEEHIRAHNDWCYTDVKRQ